MIVKSNRMYTKVGSETRGIDLYEESLWFWGIHGILIGYPLSKVVYGIFFSSIFVLLKKKRISLHQRDWQKICWKVCDWIKCSYG